MRKEAKLFITWKPLDLLIGSAVASISQDRKFLLWGGTTNEGLKLVTSACAVWDGIFDLSGSGIVRFWDYVKPHNHVIKNLRVILTDDLANYNINEILTSSDEWNFFFAFMKAYGKDGWAKTSLIEDGIGLYLTYKKANPVRYLAKVFIDILSLNPSLPRTLKFFSGNPLIRRIYTVSPELLPYKKGKEIVDIRREFLQVLFRCAEKMQQIPVLPDNSGIILSECLHEAGHMSFSEEVKLITEMVKFLRENCGIQNIYVKYHHFDRSYKRKIFDRLKVKEIPFSNLPYEILHICLKPKYVVSFGSSALFYCSFLESSSKLIAFCGGRKKWRKLSELFSQRGILVVQSRGAA